MKTCRLPCVLVLAFAACEGDQAPTGVLHKPGASRTVHVGTFPQPVKASELSNDDDPAATVETLLATYQDTYAYSATTSWYHEPESTSSRFVAMLEGFSGTELTLFALMKERHQVSPAANVWQDDSIVWDSDDDGRCDLDGIDQEDDGDADDDIGEDCLWQYEAETYARFLSGWKDASASLSRLSMGTRNAYGRPVLAGLVFDDLGLYLCDGTEGLDDDDEGCYAASDLQAILDAGRACDGCNPDWQLIPVLYHGEDVPRFLADGYFLKQAYEEAAKVGDEIVVALTYDRLDIPSEANLSFLYFDGYESESTDCAGNRDFSGKLFKFAELNGSVLFEEDVHGKQYIRRYDGGVHDLLRIGANELRIGLRVESIECANSLKYMSPREMSVWDIELTVDGVLVTPNDVALSTPDSAVADETTTRGFYASDMSAFNVAPSISGAFVFWSPDPAMYDADTYQQVLDVVDGATSYWFSGMYSTMDETALSADHLGAQINLSAAIADGLLLWNFPLGLDAQGSDEAGLFAEKASDDVSFELLHHFPSAQPGVIGFFQQHISKKSLAGTQTFVTRDNRANSATGYFSRRIVNARTGATLLDQDIGASECTGGHESASPCPGNETTVSCELHCVEGSTDQTIVLAMGRRGFKVALQLIATALVGSAEFKTYFDVPDGSEWVFQSDTTSQELKDQVTLLKTKLPTLWP